MGVTAIASPTAAARTAFNALFNALFNAPFNTLPPSGLIMLGIVSVQTGAGLAKELFAHLPPSAVVTLRLVSATVALVAFARPRISRHTWREVGVAAAFGVALATMNFSIYQSFSRVPLGVAVTIEFLGPLGVAIAGSRRRLDAIWVALAGGGVALLAKGGGQITAAGVGWALLAATAWAGYIMLSAATGRRFSGASGLTVAMVVASVVVAPIGIAQARTALLHPSYLALGAVVGVLSSLVPYTVELHALRSIPTKVFGILMSVEPAVAALVGLALLGEMLSTREWVAVGCVVVASIGATRTAKDDRPPV